MNAQIYPQIEPLFNTLLQTDDLHTLADAAAKVLQNPILLYNCSYARIAQSRCYQVNDPHWDTVTERGYWTYEVISSVRSSPSFGENSPKSNYYISQDWGPIRRRVGRLFYQQKLVGYYVLLESESPFDTVSEPVYQAVFSILAKHVNLSNVIGSYQPSTTPTQILLNLLEGSYRDRYHFESHIKGTGFERISQGRVAVLDTTEYIPEGKSTEVLHQKLSQLFPFSCSVYYKEFIVVFYDEGRLSLSERDYLQALPSLLQRERLTAGLSDPFRELLELERYYRQAVTALAYHKKLRAGGSLALYNYYKLSELVALLPPGEERIRLCSIEVRKIAQYDLEHNTAYLSTLYHYIDTGKSLKQTARRLFVHRNTIHYRIQKIKELFQVDLDDPHMNVLHHVSCSILFSLEAPQLPPGMDPPTSLI